MNFEYPILSTEQLQEEPNFQRPFALELRTKAFAAYGVGDLESAENYMDVYHEAAYKADETEAHIMNREIDANYERNLELFKEIGQLVVEDSLKMGGYRDYSAQLAIYEKIDPKRGNSDHLEKNVNTKAYRNELEIFPIAENNWNPDYKNTKTLINWLTINKSEKNNPYTD